MVILQTAPNLCADSFWPEIGTDPKGFPAWDSVFKNKMWPSKVSWGEAEESYPKLCPSRERLSHGSYTLCGPLHTETEMRAFKEEKAQHGAPGRGCREAAANRAASSLQRLHR